MTSSKPYEQELQERDARQREFDAIVQEAMQRVMAGIEGRKPPLKSHFFYGATGIHPRHLVAWYLFHTESDQQAAKQSGLIAEIKRRTRAELASCGYPAEGCTGMQVSFTSDEAIQKESGGDYWAYFK
jgi:hypothetical protein